MRAVMTGSQQMDLIDKCTFATKNAEELGERMKDPLTL
jgi:hypothetical protein